MELIQVQISKSTKVDDLLCKTTFKKNEKGNVSLVNSKTPLCNAIECVDNFPNKLVLLEGINNASPAVLEILNLIYSKKGTNILLPNGSKIVKGNINLISIFNPSDDFTREKLPTNLLNNALYFIVEDPSKNDIINIISYLFKEAKLNKNECEEFSKNFLKAQKIAKEGTGEFPLTLHEVRKYISFRKTNPLLDKTIFMTFIFNYHFSQRENIIKAQKELKLDNFLFSPTINYDGDKKYLTFKTSKKGKKNLLKLKIKNPDKIERKKLINKFNTMTLTEKLCFLFLICCVNANKTPIIQGVTSSGKSFIVKLFSEVLGQDLSIYQLNDNSGISIFTGQSIMKEEFDKEEKGKLKGILKLLNKDISTNELTSKDFIDFEREIDKKLKSEKLSEEEKKEYKKAKDILTVVKSPLNRFTHQDSELITGIKTGKWIVLDGIEMASTQISEKLSTLCGEVPTLNVFESGLEDLNFDSSNINPDFRLFIIYNPLSKNAKKIDQSLFNKCIKFTLPSIDSSPRDATTMLYESMIQNKKDSGAVLWSNLCSRIAKYHIEETKKSRENTDLIAGNIPFTSRNLCFISNDFHHSFKKNKIKIESWIQSIFENYYWRSFINYSKDKRNEFMENTLSIIKSKNDRQYKVDNELDFTEEFKEIVECLINIQKYAIRNIEYREFEFKDFLNYCLKVPINKEKLQSIYNNLEDTILLLDNYFYNMDDILVNKFYQINFIKNNYDNILNNFENVSGFEDKLELINDQLLKNEDIKSYLLRMRFLDLILQKENKKIYEPNLNYELFKPCSIEISKKLLDLMNYKTKNFFDELVIYLAENPEAFKIIHFFYPYNINELKKGELYYANYYIYFWYKLYSNKYNFSIRIKNNRYDIIFPEEDQNKKINPYFILNQEDSLYLSKGSYLKKNKRNLIDDKLECKIVYLEKTPEENTKNMFDWITYYFNELNNELPIKVEEISKLKLDTIKFFTNNSSTLIGRILSLIINLMDKFPDVLTYLKQSCCFLEKDTFEIFEGFYKNLDISNLDELIKNITDISFFCESYTESMLWKYRTLLNNFESEEYKDINYDRYYDYFKSNETSLEDELMLIENELNNLNKLNIFWKEEQIDSYKSKLTTLKNLMIIYKIKDKEDEEIIKLRKQANELLMLLEKKIKDKKVNMKSLNFLKDEITNFAKLNNPSKDLFDNLKKEVNSFINLIGKESTSKEFDTLNLPNRIDIMNIDDIKNYKYNDFILSFSLVDENLNKLFDPDTSEKANIEIINNLYKDSELDPIMTFISEKKLEFYGGNQNFSFIDKQRVKQMLRGIIILKIKNNNIDLEYVNDIVKIMNSRINGTEEIPRDEYNLSYINSDKYHKNLKIRIPLFETMDIFYLFFKYDNKNRFKLSDMFSGIKSNFGGINDVAKTILKNDNYENMVNLSEDIAKLFYQNISGNKLENEDKLDLCKFLNEEAEKEKEENNKKELYIRIASGLEFIKLFQEKILNNQKSNKKNYEFKLDDLYNLLNDKKKLMDCSNIFKKEKESLLKNKKNIFSPSFIFYINNNKTFINDLFDNLNKSDISIISDLNNNRKIDYLPFWLYILRNVSSFNCIEFGNKEIDKSISNNIVNKIKGCMIEQLKNNKSLDIKWLNLITDNISYEIIEPKIHLFYDFFNLLNNNIKLTGTYSKNIVKNELENYYYNIIDYLFKEDFNKLLDLNIYENTKNLILKLTRNPSTYLFEKMKQDINNKFFDIINKENIYNLNENFNNKFKSLSDNFISRINEANKELFNKEYQNKIAQHQTRINNKFDYLCKCIRTYETTIDNINSKKGKNPQLSENEIENLEKLKSEIINYKNYGLKEIKEGKIVYYSLKYDFTRIKEKNYQLKFIGQEIKLDSYRGTINIIDVKNTNMLKKDFTLKIIEKQSEEIRVNEKNEQELNEKITLEKNEKEKNILKLKYNQNYKAEDFINFKQSKEFSFSKYIIKDEGAIKKMIEKYLKKPSVQDVKNPPEILINKFNIEQFIKLNKYLMEISLSLFRTLIDIKNKKINEKAIIKNFENEIEKVIYNLNNLKGQLKLNINSFEYLNKASADLENEITDFLSHLKSYYKNYNNSVKCLLEEFFKLKERDIFSLDFSLPCIPKSLDKSGIVFEKMNKESKNLCVPIINVDTEEKNLTCCYKSLELNLGKICPSFYNGKYTINIISFVNEDMRVSIKSYKETKLENRIDKEKEKNEKEQEKEQELKEEKKEEEREEKPKIIYEDEVLKKYLTVKELIAKGENIQLYFEIPQTFEKETIKVNSVIKLETISGKKLELNINIIMTTIPISMLISCKNYKLIKEKVGSERGIQFEQCFKLDTKELKEDEEINFELLNYKDKEPIEFYMCAKSLKNNSSDIPNFNRDIQKNNFKIMIPHSQDNYINRLNCVLDIIINYNCIIHIIIDSIIRPNLSIFKIYDFYTKQYVENEMLIHLNENVQEIFKKNNKCIQLSCIIYSNEEGEEFKVNPEGFYGGKIRKDEKNKYIIKDGRCMFNLLLELNKDEIIGDNIESIINISIRLKKLQFKLKFLKPNNDIFSPDYYSHFPVMLKENLEDEWDYLNNFSKKKLKYYVTPFKCSQNEIDYKKATNENNLTFYYINSSDGKILVKNEYTPKIKKEKWFQNYRDYEFDICFAFKYEDNWYPLIENNGRIDNDFDIMHFEKSENIRQQVCSDFNNWEKKIDNNFLLYNGITSSNEYCEFEKSNYFYTNCEKIIKENIIKRIGKFKSIIQNFLVNKEYKNLTFEGLANLIMLNPNKCLKNLHNSFPYKIKKELNEYYNEYDKSHGNENKELALYNYIIKFRNIFNNLRREFVHQDKKIKEIIPESKEIQKKLLFSYYSIEQNQKNKNEDKPKIIIDFENKIKPFLKNIDNNIEIEIISSKKFLIIGNQNNPINENEGQKFEIKDDELNLKLDNSINILLPEINLKILKDNISLNKILEIYNASIIGCRIYPAYLQLAIINDNKENLENSKKYFNTLFTIYRQKKSNNKSLIYLAINEFVFSFENMIMKLKNAGIYFINNRLLEEIDCEIDNKSSFIKPPNKIKPLKHQNNWENQKELEKKIEYDFNTYFKRTISRQNMKAQRIGRIDTWMNNDKIDEDNLNSLDDISNKNISKNNENEEKDIKLEDLLMQDDDIILLDEKEEKKIEKKNMKFAKSNKGKDNPHIKASKEEFENLDKKYDIDYVIKYIVDNMKNKVNKNDTNFKYESKKENIKGYIPKKENLDSTLKKNLNLTISSLIENSKFLSAKIYSTVSEINYNDTKREILFNKLEANIIIDLARTISETNKYFNMLMVCGLACALNFLKIPYTLSAIGDSDFKVRIKELEEQHSELNLQKLYDICFIKRNVTQLPTCIKYFLEKYPPKNDSNNSVYYIFTNGFDQELKKCKAWKNKIFNDKKNSFSFIFTKTKALENEKNKEYKQYLQEIWNEFESESKKSLSYVTLTHISYEDIDNMDILAQNLSKVLLREKDQLNKDNSPKVNSLFNVDNSKFINSDYINLFRSVLTDELNKPEFNELYIKRNKMQFIYDNQKDNQKQFKLFCQKTGKIIRYNKLSMENQKDILRLVKEFKEKRDKIKLNHMNIVFRPNLPTQAILVEEGTHLDITELIKYSINKVPNPRLYREIRDGFVKNYGVSIVIDTSISCLNDICIIHTIQTLRILLSAISFDNIPCLDIIVSREKEPIILCSEKSANEILSERSPFWAVFFSCLLGQPSSDLASAIKAAYNLNRARKKDYTNYIFVLTDGMYSSSQRDRIIGVANSCYSKNINLFGIGVGIYPIGIEKLFSQVIYSQNPYKLIEGLSLFFGDVSKYKDITMKSFVLPPNISKISSNCKELEGHINNPIFKELKSELSTIKINLDSFPFTVPELDRNEDGTNPEGEDSGMYPQNFYEGQKILIAMFFSSKLESQKSEINTEDEMKIIPENVINKIGKEDCISSVLGYFGYKVVLVTNYEEAIKELTKTNNENKCEYNSLWVISGQEVADIPTNNGDIYAPYYVEQFVDCGIQFWRNGGSLVLLGENDPYNFQVNLFLKKIVFPNGKKIKFKIGGNHPGRKILKADNSGQLIKPMTFNKKIQEVCNVERKSLANNLEQIFEGATIAYVKGKDIDPFIPFSKDSSGGINSLFYNGLDRGKGTGEGDIFIDCGYTKFFLDMKKCGTSRYLQNIGGFIGSAERRDNNDDNYHPRFYRPEKVKFKLDKNPKYFYKYPKIPFDVVYLVDATGSMGESINKVKKYCVEIAKILEKQMMLFDFNFGAIFYRDPIDSKTDQHEYFNLNNNIENLQREMQKIKEQGGGDQPEDWVGGYAIALKYMNWRNGNKLIIHIADAGAHGSEYSLKDKYPSEGPKLDALISEFAYNKINIIAFKIGSGPQQSFSRIQMIYNYYHCNNFKIQEFDQDIKDPGYFTDLVVNNIKKIT